LLEGSKHANREDELRALHAELDRGAWDALRRARGVFAIAYYDPTAGELIVATDHLGIRPVYVGVAEDFVAFATALRIVEAVPGLRRPLNARAVTEIAGLGYPLADRTPYGSVIALRAGELVRITRDGCSRRSYWRWDEELHAPTPDRNDLARDAYDRFRDAVRVRLRGDRSTAAFLSGGLDSRLVVSSLRAEGARVYTFNFRPEGWQDRQFATRFAAAVGTVHRAVAPPPGALRWSHMMATAWREARYGADDGSIAERPNVVWAGDGGSVGAGLVYITPDVVRLLRAGRQTDAVRRFLSEQRAAVLRRLLARDAAARLGDALFAGIVEELEGIRCEDPAKAFHLFLMLNDQRRHLARHFEHVDEHRLELQLPFFDRRFLETILSVPLDWGMSHGFYDTFMGEFPAATRSVPWQTYPGHCACPLSEPSDAAYQWDEREVAASRDRDRRSLVAATRALLRDNAFPTALLRRGYLRLTTWAHAAGLRDYDYVLRTAQVYADYSRRGDGQSGPGNASMRLAEP
jgi:asparagine synthetase B (glutamine-hydrolysing)